MLIAIIGPDGSGKTTYAKHIHTYMKSKGMKVSYHELNYGFLPRISAILNIFRRTKKLLKEPEGQFHSGVKNQPYNSIKASILALYWSIDYILLRIHSALYPRRVFVFARYSFDYSFLYGYRLLPSILKSFIIAVAPTPSQTFYISRNPLAIYHAKPELPLNIINETKDIIESMLSKYNFVPINVIEGSIEETSITILSHFS